MIILRQKQYSIQGKFRQKIFMLGQYQKDANGKLIPVLNEEGEKVLASSDGSGYTLTNKEGKATKSAMMKNQGIALHQKEQQQNRANQRQINQEIAKTNPNAFKDVATRARVQGYNKGQADGFKKGQQSVGLLGGAKNIWNNMSKGRQIATGAVAGTALVGGATALALRNRNKRKKAERELERERSRR